MSDSKYTPEEIREALKRIVEILAKERDANPETVKFVEGLAEKQEEKA